MKRIDNFVANGEQLLNPVDWIPYISSFSGMVRILAGMVEVAAGAVFAYMKSVDLMLHSSKFDIWPAIEEGAMYSKHGLLNILRGAIAMLPGVNLSLALYDIQIGRYNYPEELCRWGVYRIGD